jgi:hypothetical protein
MSVNVSIWLKRPIPLLANAVRYGCVAGGMMETLAACPAGNVPRESSRATIGEQLVMAAGSAIQ